MSKERFEELRENRLEKVEERLRSERERIDKQTELEIKRGYTRQPPLKDEIMWKRIQKENKWDLKWAKRKAKIDAGTNRFEEFKRSLKQKESTVSTLSDRHGTGKNIVK